MYVFKALVSIAIYMVSEFEFIDSIKSEYGLDKIGDDCAVLPKDSVTDLLLTVDMLIEDIDFRLEWTTPEFLGHKALAVSLSDIAAMGGNPVWAMLSIGVPETIWNTDFIDEFYQGWFALAKEFGIELVGGDISRSPDKLVIDSIAGGEVANGKAIRRSSAKPGDAIFVTGTLGGAAGGLKLLERGFRDTKDPADHSSSLLLRQLKPQPKLNIANLLQSLGIVTSMIDVSDGLSSDLSHICRESHVGTRIYAERFPIDPELNHHFPSDECLRLALDGGEDFELLFTAEVESIRQLENLDVTRIGEITSTPGNLEIESHGVIKVIRPQGFQHF